MESGISFYEGIADNYLTSDPYRLKYHDNRFRAFNGLLPEVPCKILDFGCGSAENIVNMTRHGHDVTGLDPVTRLVEIGRANLSEAGLPDTLHVGDVSKLAEFESGSFDVIGALSVLSYLNEDETEEFFTQTKRLLAPGGKAVLSFSNSLVDMVTFNRYTVEFWKQEIIPFLSDDEDEREDFAGAISSSLAFPNRPETTHSENDNVTRKKRNPLTIQAELKRHGFLMEDVAFTHFHPLPPQFIEQSNKYKNIKFRAEDALPHWAGYIFASMFLVRVSYAA